MKKIVTVILLLLMTLCIFSAGALAAPGDEASPDPAASPTNTETTTAPADEGQNALTSALLSKVTVSGVKQSTMNPSNTMNVTVELKNLNDTELPGVMVAVAGQSNTGLSLTKSFGPFMVDLPSNGSGTVSFTLYVNPLILGGNYPLTLALSYVSAAGVMSTASKDISILINRENGAVGTASSAVSVPRVVVGSYDIGADKVLGNNIFDLSYTLVNTGSSSVKNLLVTLTSDSNAFTPESGKSNQIYIGSIGAGASVNGKIKLKANGTLASGSYNVNFSLQYQDVYNTAYTSTALAGIALEQQQKLSINSVRLPDTCVLGSKVPLNVSYKNPGKTDIKNLVMTLSGDILDKEKSVTIGTVAAGSSGYVDQYITPQKAGEQQIDIAFTFEDADGNTYTTAAQSISIQVKGNESAASSAPTGINGNTGVNSTATPSASTGAGFDVNSLWLVILIIGVVIIAAVVTVIIVRKRKKKVIKWNKVTK